MYRAVFYKQAARYYAKLDVKFKRKINRAMHEIIFVSVDEKTIYVEAIGPRGDVYK